MTTLAIDRLDPVGWPGVRIGLAVVLALLTVPASEAGVPCDVPADRPTIQAAIDDPDCDPIDVAAGDYPESLVVDRSVNLQGPGSAEATLWGRFEALGPAVVAVSGLEVYSACEGSAVETASGARIEAFDLAVVRTDGTCNLVVRIFDDGFESGTLDAWSSSSP